MGSYCSWVPQSKERLRKEILSEYPTREIANSFERKLLIEKLKIDKDDKCMNAHIPGIGFCTHGDAGVAKKISKSMKEWYANNEHHKPMLNKTHTKETKEKISRIHTGRKFTKGWKRKLRKNHADVKGKNHPMYGKKHSKETREKMSNSFFKRIESDGHPGEKQVIHIKSNESFDSITEAAVYFDIHRTTVSNHCRGKYNNQKFRYG